MTAIPLGLCQCGCGQWTKIAAKNCTRHGYMRGQPVRFIKGHVSKLKVSRERYMHPHGYWYVRVSPGKQRREHVLIVERLIGRSLPKGAQVHHFNGVRSDNGHGNLVACQDAAYHKLLERRQRALAACGNANWIRCRHCGQHDDPNNLTVLSRDRGLAQHRACHTARERQRRTV